MQAIETFATITDEYHVVLDKALPLSTTNRVRILVLLPNADNDGENQEPSEERWLQAAAQNAAFSFLSDEDEIYSIRDGEPFDG